LSPYCVRKCEALQGAVIKLHMEVKSMEPFVLTKKCRAFKSGNKIMELQKIKKKT
jgi:hypothetical protein